MSRSTAGRFKVAIIAALLMLPLLPGAAAAAPVAKDAASAVANAPAGTASWVVTLKPGHNPDREAPGLAKGASGKVGMTYTHALKGFVFKGSAKGAAALARNPNVRTVTPDGPTKLLADTIPTGVSRIRANHATASSAYAEGFRGAGVKVAILDTGIDLTHPDLVANIDASLGLNCMTSGPPQDGHGHGTHVAGIVAADDNGFGVVGVAPDAQVVPIKVLDDTGQGEWSNLICAIDYLTGLITDNDPSNDVRVANMSLGDTGDIGSCDDGFVREALCTSVAAGITYVAAAGNSTVDTAGFIPAAMPEVIAVSALTDLDGEPGGTGWLLAVDLLLRRHAGRVQQLRRLGRCDGARNPDLLGLDRRRVPDRGRHEHGRATCLRRGGAHALRQTRSLACGRHEFAQDHRRVPERPAGEPDRGLRRQGPVDQRPRRHRRTPRQRPARRRGSWPVRRSADGAHHEPGRWRQRHRDRHHHG